MKLLLKKEFGGYTSTGCNTPPPSNVLGPISYNINISGCENSSCLRYILVESFDL